MPARRVDNEFRAAIVKPALAPAASAPGADPLYGAQVLPRDSRSATEGVRGRLRWGQTRLGRHVRPPGDRLEISEEARRGRAGSHDERLALETLDELLAELERRGLGDHPRTRGLRLLKQRMEAEAWAISARQAGTAARPTRAAAESASAGSREGEREAPPGFLDFMAEAWDALLGVLQGPAGRAAYRKLLLAEVRRHAGKGDGPGAARRLRLLLMRDSGDGEAHARLGRLLLDRGDLAGAAPHLEAAARARPSDPSCQIALGELHYRRGEPQESLVAFGKALRLRPEHSDVNAWLGILAHEGDRPVEALRFLERAVAFDPNHAVARFYLAQVSLAQGDDLRASYQLGIVRRLDPAADLERFGVDQPRVLPARTGKPPRTGWVVPKPGRLAARPAW